MTSVIEEVEDRYHDESDSEMRSSTESVAPVFNIVDPSVRRQQDEWEYLLQISGEGENIPFTDDEIFGSVTQKYRTAAIWVTDAIHARGIDYPRNDKEVDRLELSRTEMIRTIFNIAALYQIISPFLNRPICDIASEAHAQRTGWAWFVDGGSPSITALATIDTVCLMIFSLDLYLTGSVNFELRRFVSRPWTVLRAIGTVFLFCGIICTFAGALELQLYLRCIFPFFMISRRNNLKLMLQGLIYSAYYTFPVLIALAGIITIWGFVGFFLFRAIQANGHHFDSPLQGIWTALHCFTSRPFNLSALNDVFYYESFSAVYFVTLTLAADILCTAFIIAVGNKQYKMFAAKILTKRLLDRKKAVMAIFYGLAREDPYTGETFLRLGEWKKICAEIKDRRYELTEESAEHIFGMEDHLRQGRVDLIGFTRCMGSVAARISFKQGAKLDLYDPSHHAHISHDEEDEEEEKEEGDESESEDTRAVGLGVGNRMDGRESVGDSIGLTPETVTLSGQRSTELVKAALGDKDKDKEKEKEKDVGIIDISSSPTRKTRGMSSLSLASHSEDAMQTGGGTNFGHELSPDDKEEQRYRVTHATRGGVVEVDSHGAQKERIRAKSDVGLPVRARKIPLSPAAGVSGGVSGGITGSTLTEGTVIGDNQGESSLNPIHPIMEGDDERTESVDEASAGALRRDRTSVGSTSSAKFSVRSVYEGYRPRHLSVEGSANGSASSANAGFTVQAKSALPIDEEAVLRIQHMHPEKLAFNAEEREKRMEDREVELDHWLVRVLGQNLGHFIAGSYTCLLHVIRSIIEFQIVVAFNTNSPILAALSFEDTEKASRPAFSLYSIPLYNSMFLSLVHIALVVWLCYVSEPSSSSTVKVYGWALQGVFMGDMLLKYAVYGYRGLGRTKITRIVDLAVNVITLVAMCVMEARINEGSYTSTGGPDNALTAVILAQGLRLFKLFFYFNNQDIFEDIFPTVFRAFFILFSVVYFFSVFAHGFFCSDLQVSAAVLDADDDSSEWVKNADVLNFSTFSLSLFTMFELALLGGWSTVMDAAAKTAGNRAYVFFYVYRLTVTLCVIPILVSFMMNSFIAAVTKQAAIAKSKQEEDDQHAMQKATALDFNENTSIGTETAALRMSLLDKDVREFSEAQLQETNAPVIRARTYSTTSIASRTMGRGALQADGTYAHTDSASTTSAQSSLDDQDEFNRESRSTFSPNSPNRDKDRDRDRESQTTGRASMYQMLVQSMPAVSFTTRTHDDGEGSDAKYHLHSKMGHKAAPSALSLWQGDGAHAAAAASAAAAANKESAGTGAPERGSVSGQDRESLSFNSVRGSLNSRPMGLDGLALRDSATMRDSQGGSGKMPRAGVSSQVSSSWKAGSGGSGGGGSVSGSYGASGSYNAGGSISGSLGASANSTLELEILKAELARAKQELEQEKGKAKGSTTNRK